MNTQHFMDDLIARIQGAFADNTLKAYRVDFKQYTRWCDEHQHEPLPMTAEVLADYIAWMALRYKSATIRRRIDSLGSICFLSGMDTLTKSPEVKVAMKRMHRAIGRVQDQAQPLTREHLHAMLKKCPKSTVLGMRNRVLLTLGYESMRRRSELVAFQFEDLRLLPNERFALHLRRSKTDQLGEGRLIPISDELAALIKRWARMIHSTSGPILRSVNRGGNVGDHLCDGAITNILVDLQYRARLRHVPEFSGHSFRVGAALDMLKEGVPMAEIMLRGGWKRETTALRYLQAWAESAAPVDTAATERVIGKAVF